MRKLWVKRIICFFLCVCLFTGSFAVIPTKKVYSAEYVAGIVGAIGGGPILTALLVGGCIVAGGIAVEKIVTSTPQDRADFVNGVKQSFNGFVTEYEKNLIIQSNAQITEQEAINQAVQKANSVVSDWENNMINKSITTGNGLKNETMDLWTKFSNEFNDVADNGVTSGGSSGSLNSSSPVFCEIQNFTDISTQTYSKDNIYGNCIEYNGNVYVLDGDYYPYTNQNIYNANQNGVPTDRYRFYYTMLWVQSSNRRIVQKLNNIDVNRLSGQVVATGSVYDQNIYYSNNISEIINTIANNTNMLVFLTDDSTYSTTLNSINADYTKLAVSTAIASSVPLWKQALQDTLNNTKLGDSIQTGRRTLVNNGDEITSIFGLDSVPIKKSGLAIIEGDAIGQVGYDIPDSAVWDDVISGNKPFPKVVGDTGTIVAPKSGVIETPDTGEVVIPSDTPVVDSEENTDDPDNPYPETTPEDIQENQGGEFYPTGMDLSNIFPFCIPFDIYYLFSSLVATPETPTFDIEFAYPQSLKPYLGNSFVYTLDFSDFEVVARVLKIMLSLLFIFGLMKITRSIIRG